MSSQVSCMCQSDTEACKTLVYVLVTPRLDYNIAVLCGITETLMTKLQMVQKSAASLIVRQRKQQHITRVLTELCWLPGRWRVQYKLLVLVFSHQVTCLTYGPRMHQPATFDLLICVRWYCRATNWRATADGLSRCTDLLLVRFAGLHKTSRYAV